MNFIHALKFGCEQ